MRVVVSAVIAAMVLSAAPQTARAGDPALGREVMLTLLSSPGVDTMLRDGTTAAFKGGLGPEVPKEWAPLLQEAMIEEIQADREALATLIGAEVARDMSDEKLRAGLALVRHPLLADYLTAVSLGKRPPRPIGAEKRELESLMTAPGAAQFMRKFRTLGALSPATTRLVMRELAPGLLRRFGEKAEAFEAARAR